MAVVRYPFALAMLDLLQDAHARTAVARDDVMLHLHQQQFFHWRYRGIGAPVPPALTMPTAPPTTTPAAAATPAAAP